MATVFGIGASKAVGRMDRAAPMTMEAVACSWPTPFGFLIPAAMGKVAAGSGCLGETALAFVMTRPVYAKEVVPFTGGAPRIVWLMFFAYAGTGLMFIGFEVRAWRHFLRGSQTKEAGK